MFFSKKSKPAGPVDFIVAGLGNPGKQYEATRHNAGFMGLEALAEKLGVQVTRIRFKSYCAEAAIGEKRVLLMMPQTFMNLSGRSVLPLSAYFQIPPQRIIVLFDDISLEPGRLRVRKDGSAGGHNGIKSIIAELGSEAFPRVKIGVGAKPHPDYDLAAWVLSTFSASEEKALDPALDRAGEAALCIIDHGVPEAANRFNGKN